MNSHFSVLASAACLLMGSTAAMAQSSLTFRGSSLSPIPLDVTQPLTIGDDGSVQASCLFQAGTTVCQGVSPPVSQQIPTVALSVSGLTQDGQGRYELTAGTQFAISRTITNTADVCVATSSVSATTVGWDSVFAPAATSSATVRLTSAGEYTLGLRCYNLAGAAATPTQLRFVVAAPVGPNPDSCTLPADPSIQPANFTRYVRTWNQVFQVGDFPNAPGYLVPMGSFLVNNSLPGPASAGMYISVPFTPQANRTYTLRFYPAQAIFAAGYNGDQTRRGTSFVSASRCAGDLRAPDVGSSDPDLRLCRSMVNNGQFVFTTTSNAGLCQLQAGQTYWLNFMMVNPIGGLSNTTNTCVFIDRCESLLQFSQE
jgi:hypothetical protein